MLRPSEPMLYCDWIYASSILFAIGIVFMLPTLLAFSLQEENAQMREQLGMVQGSRSQLHLTRSDFEVLEAAKEAVGEVLDDEGVGEAEQQEEEGWEAGGSEVLEEDGDKSGDEQLMA